MIFSKSLVIIIVTQLIEQCLVYLTKSYREMVFNLVKNNINLIKKKC